MLRMQAQLQGVELNFKQMTRDLKANFDKVRV